MVGGHIFKKRRLLRFCLWLFKTSQLLISQSKNKATVDVYGVCYISLVHFWYNKGVLSCCTYRRGLSRRCSFRLTGQCEGLKERDE